MNFSRGNDLSLKMGNSTRVYIEPGPDLQFSSGVLCLSDTNRGKPLSYTPALCALTPATEAGNTASTPDIPYRKLLPWSRGMQDRLCARLDAVAQRWSDLT